MKTELGSRRFSTGVAAASFQLLPVEIVSKIFLEGTRNWRLLEPQSLPFPTIIASVCRHWHMVAEDMPELWSLIIPPIHRDVGACLMWTSKWLAHSKEEPLSVILDVKLSKQADFSLPWRKWQTNQKVAGTLALFSDTKHSRRLRRLDIRAFTSSSFDKFMRGLGLEGHRAVPNLEQLSLYALDGQEYTYSFPTQHDEYWNVLHKLPSLKRFRFLNISPPVVSTLTSLTAYDQLFTEYAEIKALFVGAPHLAHIVIHNYSLMWRRNDTNSLKPISAPSLRSIALQMIPSYYNAVRNHDSSTEIMISFSPFTCVMIPALEYLEIQGQFDYDLFFGPSLSDSLGTIKKLRIAGVDQLGADNAKCFRSFHALEELEIVCAPASELFPCDEAPTSYLPKSSKVVWPQLHSLTLDTTGIKNLKSCIDFIQMRAAHPEYKIQNLDLSRSSFELLKQVGDKTLSEHRAEFRSFLMNNGAMDGPTKMVCDVASKLCLLLVGSEKRNGQSDICSSDVSHLNLDESTHVEVGLALLPENKMASRPESGPYATFEELQKWECGTPYQYPVSGNGDHWEGLLEPLLEKDSVQCQSWREEVQNILIFGGLFSAVVTAFVVLSYSNLQPDQTEIMIGLLSRIAARLDNPVDGTSSTSQLLEPASLLAGPPAPSAVRVNVFWFMSLVFSLTTALIGIVSLQWIREHQQYPSSLTPRQKIALFNMRKKSLSAWHVPGIFSSLPVLLLASLLLFFIGLIDFLLATSLRVAIPVLIVISIPLAFVALTTVVPALQSLVFILPFTDRERRVPDQAPYKSPQSILFRRLFAYSTKIFTLFANLIHSTHSLLFILPYQLCGRRKVRSDFLEEDGQAVTADPSLQDKISKICTVLQTKSWLEYDEDWLIMRDVYAKCILDGEPWMRVFNLSGFSFQPFPLFDLTNAILRTVNRFDLTSISLSYSCVQDLSSYIKALPEAVYRERFLYLQNLLQSHLEKLSSPVPTFSSLLSEPNTDFMTDESNFILLARFDAYRFPLLLQHFAELHIRIANYVYPHNASQRLRGPLSHQSDPANSLEFYYTVDRRLSPDASRFDGAISGQFSLFVKGYVQAIANPSIANETLLDSSFGQRVGQVFGSAVHAQSTQDIFSTLDFIWSNLKQAMDGGLDKRSDFLFYIASFYASVLLTLDPRFKDHNVALNGSKVDVDSKLQPYLQGLRQYRQARKTLDADLCDRLGIPNNSSTWWNFLKTGGSAEPQRTELPRTACELDPDPGVPMEELSLSDELKMNSNAEDLV